MKIQCLTEREDGGADVILTDVSPYEVQLLVEAGFVALLERMVKEQEEKNRIPALLKEKP